MRRNLFDACTVFGCQITWRLGLRCQGRIFPGSFANQCRPKLSPVNRTVAQQCLHLNQTKKYHQHTIHGIMCQNRNRCLKSNLCHTWPSPVQHWHKHLSGCWNGESETSITNRFRSFQPVGGSRDCFGSCHRTVLAVVIVQSNMHNLRTFSFECRKLVRSIVAPLGLMDCSPLAHDPSWIKLRNWNMHGSNRYSRRFGAARLPVHHWTIRVLNWNFGGNHMLGRPQHQREYNVIVRVSLCKFGFVFVNVHWPKNYWG